LNPKIALLDNGKTMFLKRNVIQQKSKSQDQSEAKELQIAKAPVSIRKMVIHIIFRITEQHKSNEMKSKSNRI
jgi:hypothetical protein